MDEIKTSKNMRTECTLTDEELIERSQEWVSKLAKSGGRDWSLQVPVNFNRDPDMLFIELCKRLQAAKAEIKELGGGHKVIGTFKYDFEKQTETYTSNIPECGGCGRNTNECVCPDFYTPAQLGGRTDTGTSLG